MYIYIYIYDKDIFIEFYYLLFVNDMGNEIVK